NSYFLSDDFVQIGRVLAGDRSLVWGREHGGFFRPLFILSYVIDSSVWGERPLGYHLTNALLHGLNSYLVYALTLSLLRPQKLAEDSARRTSLSAALLFLLHPSHTEAVSWISGRADLLATLFCLAALLAYIFYTEKRRTRYLLLSLICFVLALLSKESAASLPFIIFAFGVYFAVVSEQRKSELVRAIKTGTLFFPLLLLFVVVRRAALGAWLGGYGAEQHLNFSPGWIRDRFLQASLRALLPAFPPELSDILLKPLKSTAFILFALGAASLVILLLRWRRGREEKTVRSRQNSLALLLAAAFVLSLLPVINLRLSLFDTQGERFIYWPSVFAVMLITYTGFILISGRRWRLLLVLLLLAFYSLSLHRTNQVWSEAAETSRRLKEEIVLGASGEQSVFVINAPDNLRGVPIFHNGLEEALGIFQEKGRSPEVRVLSLHSIQSLSDGAELSSEGDAFILRLTNRSDTFTKIADGQPCVVIQERSRDTLRFRLSGCPSSAALFFFDKGKMYRVISGERGGAAR
ncbi:MAG TPA: glycosyltransferase family 39 protein, partial [Pyrinomonadaceae bacterium]|nr:glycosyltransferase family 39 protein [Pyrinomonadaceae bacterium]